MTSKTCGGCIQLQIGCMFIAVLMMIDSFWMMIGAFTYISKHNYYGSIPGINPILVAVGVASIISAIAALILYCGILNKKASWIMPWLIIGTLRIIGMIAIAIKLFIIASNVDDKRCSHESEYTYEEYTYRSSFQYTYSPTIQGWAITLFVCAIILTFFQFVLITYWKELMKKPVNQGLLMQAPPQGPVVTVNTIAPKQQQPSVIYMQQQPTHPMQYPMPQPMYPPPQQPYPGTGYHVNMQH